MEQAKFHKQKLYALIAAGIALIAMLFPWVSVSFFGITQSSNGFHDAGFLSLIGIVGVIVVAFMANKSENYTDENKRYTMLSFGAITLGALIFLLRKKSIVGNAFVDSKTGIGLWLCLLAGLSGLALLYGFIKIESKKPV